VLIDVIRLVAVGFGLLGALDVWLAGEVGAPGGDVEVG
jgi:hypothetical protein